MRNDNSEYISRDRRNEPELRENTTERRKGSSVGKWLPLLLLPLLLLGATMMTLPKSDQNNQNTQANQQGSTQQQSISGTPQPRVATDGIRTTGNNTGNATTGSTANGGTEIGIGGGPGERTSPNSAPNTGRGGE